MTDLAQFAGLLAIAIAFGYFANWFIHRPSRRERMAAGLPRKKVI